MYARRQLQALVRPHSAIFSCWLEPDDSAGVIALRCAGGKVRKGDLRIRNAHLVEDLVVLTRIRSLPLLGVERRLGVRIDIQNHVGLVSCDERIGGPQQVYLVQEHRQRRV